VHGRLPHPSGRPGRLPDSVGESLLEGLARLEAPGMVHGPVRDPATAIDKILAHGVNCLVGIPVQGLSMIRHPKSGCIPWGSIRSVLLSTDNYPNPSSTMSDRHWVARSTSTTV
jgi:hypothetical protein